jgi:hypothetical protein
MRPVHPLARVPGSRAGATRRVTARLTRWHVSCRATSGETSIIVNRAFPRACSGSLGRRSVVPSLSRSRPRSRRTSRKQGGHP